MCIVQTCGLIGTIAFLLSALPQAVKSYREGHSRGVSTGTLTLWLTGEAAMLVYAIGALDCDRFLLVNYTTNILWVGVIAFYKLFPR